MDEQHPIPQQISSYQFRLVGDMTLKQFFELAGGALVALLFYASPLHPFIKWPLMIASFMFGVALAFLPIEDRPLEKWIFSFFKSIYSPTLFTWRKGSGKGPYFQQEGVTTAPQKEFHATIFQAIQAPISAAEKEAVDALTNLEEKEEQFLDKVAQHLKIPATPPPQIQKQEEDAGPPPIHTIQPQDKKSKKVKSKEEKKEVIVKPTTPVEVEKSEKQIQGEQAQKPDEFETSSVQRQQSTQQGVVGKQAKFSPEAAPPMPPSKPNTIVGQVVEKGGKIIEGAILEILDQNGIVQRAIKTNQLGHFMIVTPLANGRYEIKAEKDDYEFEPVTFEAKGDIIPPIAIWANEAENKDGEDSKEKDKTVYEQDKNNQKSNKS